MNNNARYWVVGGEYTGTCFSKMVEGTHQVFGPFGDYDAARQVWRERATATKSCARTRYTIAREG